MKVYAVWGRENPDLDTETILMGLYDTKELAERVRDEWNKQEGHYNYEDYYIITTERIMTASDIVFPDGEGSFHFLPPKKEEEI